MYFICVNPATLSRLQLERWEYKVLSCVAGVEPPARKIDGGPAVIRDDGVFITLRPEHSAVEMNAGDLHGDGGERPAGDHQHLSHIDTIRIRNTVRGYDGRLADAEAQRDAKEIISALDGVSLATDAL